MYILYRRVFASVQHTFLTSVVYTSLISRNVQRYSQIKIVMRIYLLITRFIETKRWSGFVLFGCLLLNHRLTRLRLCLKVINILRAMLLNKVNLFCCFLFDYIRSIALSVLLSVIKMYIIILLRTYSRGAHSKKVSGGVLCSGTDFCSIFVW